LYNGLDCLVFIDGELDGFKPFEGQINKTTYDLVLGQSLPDQSGFNFSGVMDKLRIYNYGISYQKVKEIYESEISSVGDNNISNNQLLVFPNPVNDVIHISFTDEPNQEFLLSIYSISGVLINKIVTETGGDGQINTIFKVKQLKPGIYWIKIENERKVASRSVVISR